MIFDTKPEVLSPAGSWETLEAAVRSGADAIYFGAKEFSARRNAENFDADGIKNAVRYCRIRGVKTYLTLNIMLKDSELEAAARLAVSAYNAGIDGVIVQDLGLARILHECVPDLPLHASTQMSVHTASALPILKKMGFCQVVAAREMSFSALTELCAEARRLSMTVEVFVHGALCMCLSGQCLLSSFLGSRSGNRGLCAGPCRLPFSVPNGTGDDLSLKDLSLLTHIEELYKIGVRSFKIEGRMKRPEYVAAATAACRQAVDNGIVNNELSLTLKNVFSRSGFTDGYFTGKTGINMFGIRTKEDVTSADNAFPELHKLYRAERQCVPISGKIEIAANTPLKLTLCDGKNIAAVSGDIPQKAQNKSLDCDSVKRNIGKLGSTPYYLEKLDTDIGEELFVSAGQLNELRRNACTLLDEKRSEIGRKTAFINSLPDNENTSHEKNPKIFARFLNSSQIPEDLSGIDGIILALENGTPKNLPDTLQLIVDIPRGISNEKIIASRLLKFKECGFKSALCGNLAAVQISKNCGLNIVADTGLNIYNSQSALKAKEIGSSSIILSNEILVSDALKLSSPVPKGIVAYGRTPLMLLKNCPLNNGKSCDKCDKNGSITDRKDIQFPIRCRMGYSELLNSVPTWLADRMPELIGLDFIVLYFTDENQERISEIINAYKNGLPPDVKHTRGLFFRGTI